jgi:GT2 family glycosyltransferase
VAEKQSTGAQAQLEDQYVTAIVVTHDGVTWLSEVVASLSSQKLQPDQIIAVDNGSNDGSVKFLTNAGIEVIKKSRSTGFGEAVAAAVSKLPPAETDSNEQEWLWILHDDCAPDRHALAKLLEAAISRPQVGIAGPKILGWYDRKHILEVGISITENGTRWTGLEEREHDQGQHDEIKNVLAVSTAGMLIKRSLFEELGGFDPSLELFRDDIDLGWRAHIAGYSVICVGEAILYHAEASSSERRSIDVRDAILHRPLLLDRRNAAFVLLANSSWWILPWVAVQLLFTSIGRSVIYLLAKLPGYAADEIAAIGLLIFKPADLIKSRRYRKSSRVLTARVIKPFIPARSTQIRSIIEKISSALLNAFKPNRQVEEINRAKNYSDIGVIDESFDEIDFKPEKRFTRIRSLAKQPFLFGILVVLVISTLYSRNRFGLLSGGALPISTSSAKDLITSYANSWHLIGLGSSNAAPSWMPLIGFASLITAGNPQLLITITYFLVPVLLYILFYRTARKYTLTSYSAVFAAIIYSLSPVVLTAINQGRIGTISTAILLPPVFTLLEKNKKLINLSWRKIYAITLLAGIAAAFSPLFLTGWVFFQTSVLVHMYMTTTNWRSNKWQEIVNNLNDDEFKKRFALLITPILINIPNSLNLILHPITSLREPGLSIPSSDWLSVILFNPGGSSSPALYIFAPFLLYLLISLISVDQRKSAKVSIVAIAISATLSSYFIDGNGSSSQRVWSGSLIIFAQILALLSIFAIGERILPQLRSSNFGFKHIASAATVVTTIISMVLITTWTATAGANSLVKAHQEKVIPAFITDLASTNEKPKTLVIRKSPNQLQYFITRGEDLKLGDPDIASKTPVQVHNSIVDLVNGIGANSGRVLGFYGIQYIYMKNPADAGLVRTIDGIGGFTRSSATKDGVVWKVNNSLARVTYLNTKGKYFPINLNDASNAYVPGEGLIILAEKFDKHWELLLDGKLIKANENLYGLPEFKIPSKGNISLVHNGTSRRAWVSLQLIVIITVIILALPSGRKRREVPLEELT